MFRTCIYCHHDLEANESVENFPVGRSLAFDAEKGRLWVICRACRCWNLTPLEERWEAIEDCARLFCTTRSRYSTDQIGLAQLSSGMELIRIGRPPRREFAAWRYARRFARRRLEGIVRYVTNEGLEVAMRLTGVFPVLLPLALAGAGLRRRTVARIPVRDGSVARLKREDLPRVRLEPSGHADGFALNFIYWHPTTPWWKYAREAGETRTVRLYGAEAVRAAGQVLPRINAFGGTRDQVDHAVSYVEATRGDTKKLFASIPSLYPGTARLASLPARMRLAMEMAAHEETERRALTGELDLLEEQWREAEEIAAIADRLLVPAKIEAWIRAHRGKRGGEMDGRSSSGKRGAGAGDGGGAEPANTA